MQVELIAFTPNPDDVCGLAARNCVSETIPSPGIVYGDWSKNESALRHAMQSSHTSVAENATFTFAISGVSRVTETQLIRHRIGASYAIQSGRYCTRDPTAYLVPFSLTVSEFDAIKRLNDALVELDNIMVENGRPAEDRRYFYPQGITTNIVCTFNARELIHFCGLRRCTRAQKEIRELADKMAELVKSVAPILGSYMVPKCEQTGRCDERKSCGRVKE